MDSIWFSDEAHFYLNASEKKMCFWVLTFVELKHLHADKILFGLQFGLQESFVLILYDFDGECMKHKFAEKKIFNSHST